MTEAKKRTAREIIAGYDGPKIRIMEVCGTHTHEIFRLGIRSILPQNMELISGPGCPVCVTPTGFLDEALLLALEHGCTICTFGDLVRVPGSEMSLADARAKGAKVQVVYTPADAVAYAAQHPKEQVVFLAVGFETTTPSACLSVEQAKEAGLANYAILAANKTMEPAYRALKDSADAFLFPGHVHAITGAGVCRRLLAEGISGVVCGFTSREILTALAYIAAGMERGRPFFKNCYPRVVTEEGSPSGVALIRKVMEPCDAIWRGLGVIPGSGLRLREAYAAFDAEKKFGIPRMRGHANPACRCGDVLQGRCRPSDCPVFDNGCTPQHPVGACMVSNEGTCSAYYQYARW